MEHEIGELAPPVLVEAHYLAVEDGGLRADFLRERSGEQVELSERKLQRLTPKETLVLGHSEA